MIYVHLKDDDEAVRYQIQQELLRAGYRKTEFHVYRNDEDLTAPYQVTAPRNQFIPICNIVEDVIDGPIFIGTKTNHRPALAPHPPPG